MFLRNYSLIGGFFTIVIILKWEINNQFKRVDIEGIVEREINLTTSLKKSYTLKESIEFFTNQEQLDENDTWYCPRCKEHQRAFKKLDLWSLPKILIIHLKRFQYTRYSREKIDTEIQIPTRGLDLSDKILDQNHENRVYDLIGLSNHSGGLGSGHYTAKALNKNDWHEFNDSSAYKIPEGLAEILNSREAYLLFYRRRESNTMRKTRSSTSNLISPSKNNVNPNASEAATSLRRRTSESKMEID